MSIDTKINNPSNNNLKNKSIMKTINLTLTGLTVSEVLMAMQVNKLSPLYLGTDQNCNLLYSVKYSQEKESIIETILKFISEVDEMEKGFNSTIEELMIKANLKISHDERVQLKPFKITVLKNIYKIFKSIGDE